MPTLTAVQADITRLAVDAIVNAANNRMRGGGGVDGAIHRAGGPAVLRDCVERFPNGLATGDAGWTTAGDLPARYVIHTVGPHHAAGQTDRTLLESCYRRCLEVADELGVRTIAFPLISAGVYGWPRLDAIAAAVDTVAATPTHVEQVQLVAFDQAAYEEIDAVLARDTPLLILRAVRELHRRGFQRLRVHPGMSASGMYWRVSLSASGDAEREPVLRYTTGSGTAFADGVVTVTTTPEQVAELILAALDPETLRGEDAPYARWYDELMELVERHRRVPIAYADYFEDADGWEVGWGSGVRHPHPPA